MNYYIDLLPFSISKKHPYNFDKNGVILSKIPYTQEYHYHTTSIASYALKNSDNPQIFNDQIQWLVQNIKDNGAYEHNFSFPYYNKFPVPWIGGLCQGLAISALIRAYKKSKKKTYLEIAEKAFSCLNREIKDDGCLFIDGKGNKWIEEYPIKPQILNGFIYSLFGIYDLYKTNQNKYVKKLFDECINTIQTNLNSYDINYWSKYDLKNQLPSTMFYHKVHVKQLDALHRITKVKMFKEYSYRWNKCMDNRFYQIKAKIKRNKSIIRKHGISKSINRYVQRRRWLNG